MATATKVNGVDTKALHDTCALIKKNPSVAKGEFRAANRWVDGGHNEVRIQSYYAAGQEQQTRRQPYVLQADEPPALLGGDAGANPVEYLLTALSSCMTTSIVYHLSAAGYHIKALSSQFKGQIDLQGFLGLDPKVPKGFQKIEATFIIDSDAPLAVVEQAYHYSPVYNMVSKGVPIEVTIEQQ